MEVLQYSMDPGDREHLTEEHDQPEPGNINFELPTKLEIVEAINQLKNGKAPREDNITAEVLKADLLISADILLPLLQKI